MKRFEGVSVIDIEALDLKNGERVLLVKGETPVAALVSVEDLERLQALDARRASQEEAARRGEPWERWEEALLLDPALTGEEIASATQRTPHSINERRRWFRRFTAEGSR